MDRKLAIPAAIAGSVHAILLFGFSTPPANDAKAQSAHEGRPLAPIIQLEPQDPEIVAGEVVSKRAGSILPGLQEVVSDKRPGDIAIELTAPRTKVDDVGRIDKVGDGGLSEALENIGRHGIATLASLDNTPNTRFQVSPEYPYSLKASGVTGEVLVEFVVDVNGRVRDVRVIKSSHPDFDAPTIRAVSKWRFEPGRRNNVPVAFRMSAPVTFRIGE